MPTIRQTRRPLDQKTLRFETLEDRRLLAAGMLDQTFGVDGKVTTDFIGYSDRVSHVAVQTDGKIVVVGYSVHGANDNFTDYDLAVARYNADGTLDTSFDGDGKLTTDVSLFNDFPDSLALQGDGKIVVVGASYDGSKRDFFLVRYNVDGTLDSSFDDDGKLTTDFGGSVALQSDGEILIAGSIDGDFAMLRYNVDGTLDSSFDGDGKLTTDFGGQSEGAGSVTLQSDGKIVVAGSSNNDFALARYNADGTLDATFGLGGKVTTDFGKNEYAQNVALQSDGKIIAAGYRMTGSTTSGSTPEDFAIARYEGDPILPPTLTGDFNRSGTVDAADYLLWRNTQDLVVAAHSGADGDGDGTIDQDDYDLWKANFGRTLPAASSTALAPSATLANSVIVPMRPFDSASTALVPTARAGSRGFQPVKRDIAALAAAHDHALLAWLAARPTQSQRELLTANISQSLRELDRDFSFEPHGSLEVAFASIAESAPNDFR